MVCERGKGEGYRKYVGGNVKGRREEKVWCVREKSGRES